jgi:hypothetical protein
VLIELPSIQRYKTGDEIRFLGNVAITLEIFAILVKAGIIMAISL